jgi:hypothetical protein
MLASVVGDGHNPQRAALWALTLMAVAGFSALIRQDGA